MSTATQPQGSMAVDEIRGVVAVYDTMAAATETVSSLARAGIPPERLSVITQNLESETTVHGFVTMGDVASEGALTGAGVGAVFGLLTGAAFFVVPGVGPVLAAGALVAPLLGFMEGMAGGAAVGGLVGAITGHFMGKRHIPKLEQQLRAGKYLVIVDGEPDLINRARSLLTGTEAVEVISDDAAR